MKNDNLFPTTLYLSRIRAYSPTSFLDLMSNPYRELINAEVSEEKFNDSVQSLYLPLLSFIIDQKLSVTLVITGDFITSSSGYPELIQLINDGIKNGNFVIVANAFYGNSLTSLYNSQSWADSIKSSLVAIKSVLGIDVTFAYLPQLFRGLEIERLSDQIQHFVTRHKTATYNNVAIANSELRRHNGNTVSWINQQNDQECNYYFVPNQLFFDPNEILFDRTNKQAKIALSMKIGLATAKSQMRKTPWKPIPLKEHPRLNEKYSLTLYSPLERGVIRLWEYGFLLITSTYSQKPNDLAIWLFNQYQQLQNADYLHFLKRTNYHPKGLDLFSSPYEAFVNMQTAVKQIEILLKNQI